MEPIDAVRQYGADGPRLHVAEAHFLSFLRHGQTSLVALLWLIATAVLTTVMVTVGILFATDAVTLAARGELAAAVVQRVNDGNPMTANIVYATGPMGIPALVEPVAEGREVGRTMQVVYDPLKPSRVRDAALPRYRWGDFMPLGLAAVALWLTTIEYRWWRWLANREHKRRRAR